MNEPIKPLSSIRVWLALLATAGAAVGIVPPAITALKSKPTVSQQGNGNVAIGEIKTDSHDVINTDAHTESHTTYLSMYQSMWMAGVRTLVGADTGKARTADIAMTPPAAGLPPNAQAQAQAQALAPERGALGRLLTHGSLMNESSWSPEPSQVRRLLSFALRVEATAPDDKQGTLDATLYRDGHDVCTLSLNTRTSPLGSGVRWADAACTDTLAPHASVTYKAKVRASEMTPVTVRLDHVDAALK